MQAERMAGLVPEDDLDRITHLRAEQRAQHAEMLPARRTRLDGAEAAIGVLAVDGLSVDPPDAVGRARGQDLVESLEPMAGHGVGAAWRVVPGDFLGGDVVG